MKTIKYILFIIMVILTISSSCVEKHSGKPLFIRNNSDQTIYYWYAHWSGWDFFTEYEYNFTDYHYPDTILPSKYPGSLRNINPHNIVHGSRESKTPNWEKIFSDLPEGKFSVYFFTECPQTQEEWDLIRENFMLYRKDVTYQEFVDDGYTVSYP